MIQSILSFLEAHSGISSAMLVAILDFLIAIDPSLKSNSLIELLLVVLKFRKSEPKK